MKRMLWMMVCCLALLAGAALAEAHVCEDFKYVVLEDGTAEIRGYTGDLKWIRIPAEVNGIPVTSIGKNAFYGDRILSYITLPEGVKHIGSVVPLGKNPFAYFERLAEIRVDEDHPVLTVIDGGLYHMEEKKLICYPAARSAASYTIPQGTVEIGASAFDSCSRLTGITIPDSVTRIGSSAFSGCSTLTAVTIPDSVVTIGKKTFENCASTLTLTVGLDSCAHQYAVANKTDFLHPDFLDWLTN